jgi:hypothetical protein
MAAKVWRTVMSTQWIYEWQKQRQMLQARSKESEMDFLARCELPPHPHALAIACAVRCAIGKQAEVTPDAIQAADRIPEDLGDIFIQDSPDVIGFLLVLEGELGVRIPHSVALSVVDFAAKETVTVKEIVTIFFSVLAPILSTRGSR